MEELCHAMWKNECTVKGMNNGPGQPPPPGCHRPETIAWVPLTAWAPLTDWVKLTACWGKRQANLHQAAHHVVLHQLGPAAVVHCQAPDRPARRRHDLLVGGVLPHLSQQEPWHAVRPTDGPTDGEPVQPTCT